MYYNSKPPNKKLNALRIFSGDYSVCVYNCFSLMVYEYDMLKSDCRAGVDVQKRTA